MPGVAEMRGAFEIVPRRTGAVAPPATAGTL